VESIANSSFQERLHSWDHSVAYPSESIAQSDDPLLQTAEYLARNESTVPLIRRAENRSLVPRDVSTKGAAEAARSSQRNIMGRNIFR
jgi:hypothetical protein